MAMKQVRLAATFSVGSPKRPVELAPGSEIIMDAGDAERYRNAGLVTILGDAPEPHAPKAPAGGRAKGGNEPSGSSAPVPPPANAEPPAAPPSTEAPAAGGAASDAATGAPQPSLV